MLKIRDFAFDFDLSAPEDLERYLRSSAAMQEKERQAPPAPADPADPQYLADYTAWLKCYCGLLTDWIDDVLGAGACNRLLGPKTSLAGLLDVYDEIAAAAAAQGSAIGRHLAQYTPNRAAGKTARAAGKAARTAGK